MTLYRGYPESSTVLLRWLCSRSNPKNVLSRSAIVSFANAFMFYLLCVLSARVPWLLSAVIYFLRSFNSQTSPSLSACQKILTVNVTIHSNKKWAAILRPANMTFPSIRQPNVTDHIHDSTTIIHILARGSGKCRKGFLLWLKMYS